MEIAFLPNWMLASLTPNESVRWHLNVLCSCILVTLALSFSAADGISAVIPHVCIAQYLFRIPCPGCGVTRSLVALSRLDIGAAWNDNPVGPFLGGFLLLQIPARILAICSSQFGAAFNGFSSAASRVLIVGLISVWLHKIL